MLIGLLFIKLINHELIVLYLRKTNKMHNFLNNLFHLIYLNNNILTAIELSPGGSGYFTCIQNMKLVTNKFKSEGLHEKHVVATWNVGNHLSVCL